MQTKGKSRKLHLLRDAKTNHSAKLDSVNLSANVGSGNLHRLIRQDKSIVDRPTLICILDFYLSTHTYKRQRAAIFEINLGRLGMKMPLSLATLRLGGWQQSWEKWKWAAE